jgi:hypothetical protein
MSTLNLDFLLTSDQGRQLAELVLKVGDEVVERPCRRPAR